MSILVTGGKGFIGQHLVKELEKLGEDVVISDPKIGRPVQEFNDHEFKKFSTIFHLGATARVGVSLEAPESSSENNFTSTIKLLGACRSNPNIRLIFISSSSVKFADLTKNPYALSKKFGEDLVKLYRTTYGINATSVRLYNVYGPGEADYGSNTTLLKACKKAILIGRNPQINGDGTIVRDYTHVNDVISGLLAIYKEKELKPLYELGSGKANVDVKTIVEEFIKCTSLSIDWKPSRFGDPQVTCADISLCPEGWKPKIKVLDYIRDWKDSGCPND